MISLRRIRPGSERGLTLIEFIMAAALSSVVFMLLYVILDMALDSYAVGQLRSNAIQTARQTMSMMGSEIQDAEEIYYANADSILFRYKTFEQITVNTIQEVEWLVKYAFRADAGVVIREYTELSPVPGAPVTNTFASGVIGFGLGYYDGFYNPAASMPSLRFIEIDLRLQNEDYTVTLHNLVSLQTARLLP